MTKPIFGIYIIGDEILSGKRQDAHLSKAIELLKERGLQLSAVLPVKKLFFHLVVLVPRLTITHARQPPRR
jgi:hypothetical protein